MRVSASVAAACLAALVEILVVGCATDRGAPSARATAPTESAQEPFRFHISFCVNLHEVLLHESLLPKPGFDGPKSLAHHSVAPTADLPPRRWAGANDPRRTWHFLLFYTAGHVAKERLGPSYVPYAERPENHIFNGKAAEILQVLVRAWQPYLDGRTTLASAVNAVVAAF